MEELSLEVKAERKSGLRLFYPLDVQLAFAVTG